MAYKKIYIITLENHKLGGIVKQIINFTWSIFISVKMLVLFNKTPIFLFIFLCLLSLYKISLIIKNNLKHEQLQTKPGSNR